MKIKNHRDFWAGLLFVGAGSLFVIGATAHDVGVSRLPGPGYFPLLLGVVLVLLGCLVNFKAVTFETDDGAPVGVTNWRVLSTTLGALGLAGVLLPVVGVWVTILLLAVVMGLAAGRFSVLAWLGISMLAALLCWLVFGQLLGMPLLQISTMGG